jgi:methionyl-tRNA formyltransferase
MASFHCQLYLQLNFHPLTQPLTYNQRMRIFILSMEDPVYTAPFLREVIDARKGQIVGLATSDGDRLTIGKNRSKNTYVFSLLLIMGIGPFIRYSWTTARFKLNKILAKRGLAKNPTLRAYAESQGIPTWHIKTPNSKAFLDELRALNIDVIINQSQNILKAGLLSVPKLGTLNRHNALLPKNRGRLTPFWVLYKQEPETGVSIHWVTEGIDAGDIVVQERYAVSKKDTFASLVDKNYQIAPKAMIKALSLLESGNYVPIDNPDEEATYNTVPTFKEAWTYRRRKLFGR